MIETDHILFCIALNLLIAWLGSLESLRMFKAFFGHAIATVRDATLTWINGEFISEMWLGWNCDLCGDRADDELLVVRLLLLVEVLNRN